MSANSKKVVLVAICGNAVLTILKFTVAVSTYSAALMNEAIHRLMDTLNQCCALGYWVLDSDCSNAGCHCSIFRHEQYAFCFRCA